MNLLAGDNPLRIASLALAVVLWFIIAGRDTAERGLTVPVEFRNVPGDLEFTGDSVNTVDVRVRASPRLIESLDAGQVLVPIDLEGAEEGERIIQLTLDRVEVPFGFRVVRVTPSILTLHLEPTETREVTVVPRFRPGSPAPGYEIAGVTIAPPEVRVRGPRNRVQEIESAFTEPISVEGADADVVALVNVRPEDPLLRLGDGEGQVRVTVTIRERAGQRTFEDLPVSARGRPAEFVPSVVRVVVSGPARVLADMDVTDLRPYVNVPAELREAQTLPVAIEIASGHTGASVVLTEPAEVVARPLPVGSPQ